MSLTKHPTRTNSPCLQRYQ